MLDVLVGIVMGCVINTTQGPARLLTEVGVRAVQNVAVEEDGRARRHLTVNELHALQNDLEPLGVDTRLRATPGRLLEVIQTANRLVKEIRAGANIGAVDAQFSHNAIGGSGGDMGWMREGQLRPELASVIDKMAVGDVSDPIRTADAIHIVYLRQRR